jgi:hypothetical protein
MPDLAFIATVRSLGRSALLLLALLLLLLSYPLLGETVLLRLIAGFLNAAILVTAIYALSHSRRALLTALCLAVPALGLQVFFLLNNREIVGDLLYLTYAVFYLYTIGRVLLYVLTPGRVTGDKVYAAISGYILAGLLWAATYLLVERVHPGAFSYPGKPPDWEDFLYFSFTTLTTTGYGDLVPVSPRARSFVILEQLAGTFYVAILIARLTGLYQRIAGRSAHHE